MAADASRVRTEVVPTATTRPPRALARATACAVSAGHDVGLRQHAVVLDPRRGHGAERARADVQHDLRRLHAPRGSRSRSEGVKCRPAVGAAMLPGSRAYTVW